MPMNANEQQAKEHDYQVLFKRLKNYMANIFGHCDIFPVYSTAQVDDYSKYDMSFFDVDEKIRLQKEVFPMKSQESIELGKRLVS